MNSSEVAQILRNSGLPVETNKDLTSYNSMGFQISAELFITLKTKSDFEKLAAASQKLSKDYPLLILGGGSNIVFTKNFKGLVAHTQNKEITHLQGPNNTFLVTAQSGENWADFVDHCCDRNWCGLENLALIPGSVGAGPIQNIGAYGAELKDHFHSLEAIHLPTGKWRTFSLEDCNFAYRESFFKTSEGKDYLIYSVTFKLHNSGHFNIRYPDLIRELQDTTPLSASLIANAVKNIRRRKLPDPKNLGNVGSFFKNPILDLKQFTPLRQQHPDIPYFQMGDEYVKVPAAWLIDRAGWKGYQHNGVGVHKDQALVLVNLGKGDGQKIKELADTITRDILTKYQINLDAEPIII